MSTQSQKAYVASKENAFRDMEHFSRQQYLISLLQCHLAFFIKIIPDILFLSRL
jgi:hypothetical protein